jgi:hypothetical protein
MLSLRGGKTFISISILSLALGTVALAAGCNQPVGDANGAQPVRPELPNKAPNPPREGETVTMSRQCANVGDHMVVSFTSDRAFACGDKVTIAGVQAEGRRAYNEADKRWSLAFLVPEGATSGDVVVWSCNGGEVLLGRLQIPCAEAEEGGTGHAFAPYAGVLMIAQGCDDKDGTVKLEGFTADSFVMTGLADNGPITFKVNGKTAEAEGVTQYGMGGHTVKLEIDDATGMIRFAASSPEGSCSAVMKKP